jgi:hypothetical protein
MIELWWKCLQLGSGYKVMGLRWTFVASLIGIRILAACFVRNADFLHLPFLLINNLLSV